MRWPLIVIALTLIYSALHLVWYWQTPLGQSPVLDERENLTLAAQIAGQSLPAEPFYRAMGYPLFLAFFVKAGAPAAAMPFVATAAGVVLHLLNTWLVLQLSRHLFRIPNAGLIAGLVYGLNPVLVHYATQVLDGTLANSAFLAGALALASTRPAIRTWVGAGICWSLAALIRPQFLLVLPVLPVVGWWWTENKIRHRTALIALLAATVSASVPWIAQGIIQQHLSGKFRLMPTQGAYNLWAANRPGAHGRYFVQTIHLDVSASHVNPTRIESETLFTRETGHAPANVDEVNAHWSRRLREVVLADPVSWIGRLARKTYFLLNDAEQYNNKTYAFHKALSPVLRFNPLGWGLLMLAAVAGWTVLGAYAPNKSLGFAALTITVVASIIFAYVSARFRLPMTACLCILAGGVALLPRWWSNAAPLRRGALIIILVICAFITFSRFFDVDSKETYLQDHLLIANAAVQTGDDHEAWLQAKAALSLASSHPDALAWMLTSYYNLILSADNDPVDESSWASAARYSTEHSLHTKNPSLQVIAGIAIWRAGDRQTATTLWRTLTRSPGGSDEALAALSIAKLTSSEEDSRLLRLAHTQPATPPLVRIAAARMDNTTDASTAYFRSVAERLLSSAVNPP